MINKINLPPRAMFFKSNTRWMLYWYSVTTRYFTTLYATPFRVNVYWIWIYDQLKRYAEVSWCKSPLRRLASDNLFLLKGRGSGNIFMKLQRLWLDQWLDSSTRNLNWLKRLNFSQRQRPPNERLVKGFSTFIACKSTFDN